MEGTLKVWLVTGGEVAMAAHPWKVVWLVDHLLFYWNPTHPETENIEVKTRSSQVVREDK